MGECVKFTYYGREYEMEEKQIEAAYRFRERQYRMDDAKRHLIMEVNEYANEIEDLSVEDMIEFRRQFGIDITEAMEVLDVIVDEFESHYDCNVTENAVWKYVIEKVLTCV
mgnify:CR=1 FL=1